MLMNQLGEQIFEIHTYNVDFIVTLQQGEILLPH